MTWNPDWTQTHSPPTLEYGMVGEEHEPELVALPGSLKVLI